jgi:hypothetical protein
MTELARTHQLHGVQPVSEANGPRDSGRVAP